MDHWNAVDTSGQTQTLPGFSRYRQMSFHQHNIHYQFSSNFHFMSWRNIFLFVFLSSQMCQTDANTFIFGYMVDAMVAANS